MRGLEDKCAVITGAAGGIGRATALRLASEGASVVLVDRLAEPLAELRAQLVDGGHDRAAFAVADLTCEDDVAAAVKTAVATFGQVDILINNAGIPGPTKPMIECEERELREVFDVNVIGTWRMIRLFVPHMPSGSVIINTSSTVGIKAAPLVSIYGASKQAVLSLTRSAAVELAGRGIRVNAICPGTVETAMTEHIERSLNPEDPSKIHERFAKAVPLRRYGTAEEIAGLMAYLASDDAAYVTGATYLIDGGATVA